MTETTSRIRKKETIVQARRGWADILGIWRLCTKPACQRAHACRGPIRICFKAYFPLLPEGVQLWFEMIADAQDQGLDFDRAIETLQGTLAEDALERWHEAIAQAMDVQNATRRKSPAAKEH